MASSSSPHVVMVPSPFAGHTIPFIETAKQLSALGVTISLVIFDAWVPELEQKYGDLSSQGVSIIGLGDGMPKMLVPEFAMALAEKQFEDKLSHLLEAKILDLRAAASRTGAELEEELLVPAAGAPCCILFDMFVTWTQCVGYKLNIATDMLFVSPAVALSVFLQLKRLVEEGRLPLTPENQSELITFVPGVPSVHPSDLPAAMRDPGVFRNFTIYNHMRFPNASLILVNTFHQLEGTVLDALQAHITSTEGVKTERILAIGPLLPESHFSSGKTAQNVLQEGTEQRHLCLQWLNTQAPSSVLFISFGSFATISAEQIVELAHGLEASEQPFLWILRHPDTGLKAPPSISALLPSGFEERTKAHGLCFSGWAPQMQILRHQATGGFLTHCGWNSTLESITTGIPMLAWPMTAEQNLICRFLVDSAKLAIEMQKAPDGLVKKEVVRRSVRLLMQEEQGRAVKSKVEEMRVLSRKAVAEGGSSKQNLDEYVQQLKTRTLQIMQ